MKTPSMCPTRALNARALTVLALTVLALLMGAQTARAQSVPPFVPASPAPAGAPASDDAPAVASPPAIPGFGAVGADGYRTDVPGVARPQNRRTGPASIDPATSAGDFRTTYAAQSRPRIVVYWFRQLDEVSGQDCAVQIISRESNSKSGKAGGDLGVLGKGQIDGQMQGSRESSDCVVIGKRGVEGGRVGLAPDETFGAGFEAAFTQTLIAATARLVDRRTIIRGTAAGTSPGAGNLQNIEMAALQGKAEILMEIVMLADPRSPTGKSFSVSLKKIADGEILGALVTRAVPPEYLRRRFEAGDGGFVRGQREQLDTVGDDDDIETQNGWVMTPDGFQRGNRQISTSTIAKRLANETMLSLAKRWGG